MKLLKHNQMNGSFNFNKIDIKTLLDFVYYPGNVILRYDKSASDSRIAKGVDGHVQVSDFKHELFLYSEILMVMSESLADRFDDCPTNHLQQNFIDLLKDLSLQIETFHGNNY